MIELTPDAERQIDALRDHYIRLARVEALLNLEVALGQAFERIERHPAAGLRAPRPYPALALRGRAWIKSGRYWIAYRAATPPVVVGVFHDSADIPQRI